MDRSGSDGETTRCLVNGKNKRVVVRRELSLSIPRNLVLHELNRG